MNYHFYSHLYLHLKNIFTLKRLSTSIDGKTSSFISYSINVRKTLEE